jgi:hypothetical protein
MQQVEITIENGTPTIKVRGCKGKSCKDLTRDLEKALGDAETTTPTAEFYEKASQTNKASR